MRRLVLIANSSALSADRSRQEADTAAASIITRFVAGGLLLSHSARKDVGVTLIFDGRSCVSFEGGSMRNVRPDEQSLSGIIRAGLRRLTVAGKGRIMQGINVFNEPMEEQLEDLIGTRIFYAGAGGKTANLQPQQDFSAVFQHPTLGSQTRETLLKAGFIQVRLGRCQLSVDQAVVALNNMADRGPFAGSAM